MNYCSPEAAHPDMLVAEPVDKSSAPLKTREQARAWFTDHGITITDWAKQRGFSRMGCVEVLTGRNQGLRGEAHRIAVALGLKRTPSKDQP